MIQRFVIIFLALIGFTLAFADSSKGLGPKEGQQAPAFYLKDLQGNNVFLRDFCGETLRKPWKNKTKHVVVLSFFATWCVPCQKEIPILQELQQKYDDQPLKIFLINVGEKKDKVAPFVKEKGYTIPVLLDKYNVIAAKKYKVFALPHLYIIDREGKIRLVKQGFKDRENFMDTVLPVLEGLLQKDGQKEPAKSE